MTPTPAMSPLQPVSRQAAGSTISRGGLEVAPLDQSGPSRDPSPVVAETFEMLIMQPTTLCNLDCSYCYLPDRKSRRMMSVRVAQRVAASVEDQTGSSEAESSPVDVVWHAGEPLVTPIQHFRSLLAEFEPLRAERLVRHQVQTNATLVNNAWCDVFEEYGFRVGISIDGPATSNVNRLDWAGKPSFDRVLDGAEMLTRRGIPYHAICVVTPETVDRGRELVQFFATLDGCESVGFNIEEHEGVATGRRNIDRDEATGFWRDILQETKDHDLLVRELRDLASYLSSPRHEASSGQEPIPTVAYNGDVVLLSPELAGIKDPTYGDFRAGNVLTTPIPRMIQDAHHLQYLREFATGMAACREVCEFWDFCRGAQAGNRYFEHGTFTATETNYCRNTKQALIIAAAELTARGATETGQRRTKGNRP